MCLNRMVLVFVLIFLYGVNCEILAMKNFIAKTKSESKTAKAAATCWNTNAQIDLDIHKVRARILVAGDYWWDPVGQTPFYEVPIGSGKNSIYCGSFWIGGIDNAGQIKVAAQTYRQQGANDMWGGPISRDPAFGNAGGITDVKCDQYD